MKKSIPLFNFQTEIVFVDDDPFFLKSLACIIDKSIKIKVFSNTDEALEFLSKRSLIEDNLNYLLKESEENMAQFEFEDDEKINLEPLHTRIFNNPILDTSVVFVDYHMKGINGIDFCRKIANLPVKKVIMTAGMEEGKALKAFNEGIIDFFISKKDDDFYDLLLIAIEKMQLQFFLELSRKLCVFRETDNSQEYTDEFQSFLKDKKIQAYYALDEYGSYVCFDKRNEKYFFLCWDENKLEESISIAKSYKIENAILKVLEEKTHGVFLSSEDDMKKYVSEWKNHLYQFKGTFTINEFPYYYWHS